VDKGRSNEETNPFPAYYAKWLPDPDISFLFRWSWFPSLTTTPFRPSFFLIRQDSSRLTGRWQGSSKLKKNADR
jgi:hypothetical protein